MPLLPPPSPRAPPPLRPAAAPPPRARPALGPGRSRLTPDPGRRPSAEGGGAAARGWASPRLDASGTSTRKRTGRVRSAAPFGPSPPAPVGAEGSRASGGGTGATRGGRQRASQRRAAGRDFEARAGAPYTGATSPRGRTETRSASDPRVPEERSGEDSERHPSPGRASRKGPLRPASCSVRVDACWDRPDPTQAPVVSSSLVHGLWRGPNGTGHCS